MGSTKKSEALHATTVRRLGSQGVRGRYIPLGVEINNQQGCVIGLPSPLRHLYLNIKGLSESFMSHFHFHFRFRFRDPASQPQPAAATRRSHTAPTRCRQGASTRRLSRQLRDASSSPASRKAPARGPVFQGLPRAIWCLHGMVASLRAKFRKASMSAYTSQSGMPSKPIP